VTTQIGRNSNESRVAIIQATHNECHLPSVSRTAPVISPHCLCIYSDKTNRIHTAIVYVTLCPDVALWWVTL